MAFGDSVLSTTLDKNEGVELERPGEDGRRRAARGSLLGVGVKLYMPDIGPLPCGNSAASRPLTRTDAAPHTDRMRKQQTLGTNQGHLASGVIN
jgi:hypothetical protein